MSEQEEIDFKDTSQVLHVLRNPYGWNDHIVRNARLIAADAIEQKDKELAALHERCSPSKVLQIGDTGHYVSEKVYAAFQQQAAEIEALREGLLALINIAERCDSWESFPSNALDAAYKVLEGSK